MMIFHSYVNVYQRVNLHHVTLKCKKKDPPRPESGIFGYKRLQVFQRLLYCGKAYARNFPWFKKETHERCVISLSSQISGYIMIYAIFHKPQFGMLTTIGSSSLATIYSEVCFIPFFPKRLQTYD